MPLPKKAQENMTDSDKVVPDDDNKTASDKVTAPEVYEGAEKDDEGNPYGTTYIVFNNPETGEKERLAHHEYIKLRDRKGW